MGRRKQTQEAGRTNELASIARLWGITIEGAKAEDEQSREAGCNLSDRVQASLDASGARERHERLGEAKTREKRFGAILECILGAALLGVDANGFDPLTHIGWDSAMDDFEWWPKRDRRKKKKLGANGEAR